MDTAGIGPRFVALFCDWFVFLILFVLVALVTGPDNGGTATAGTAPHAHFFVGLEGTAFFVWGALSLAYFVGMEVTFGATLGKLVVGLRVVDKDGDEITFVAALVRNVLRSVDLLFFGLVGAAFMSSSAYNQRLGDRAAGTYVVRHDKNLVATYQ
jgi:uncharacterized RDD family membrane protein YckC